MDLDPNKRYLRQASTGAIFGWCQAFADRPDMDDYIPEKTVGKKAAAPKKKAAAPKKKAPVTIDVTASKVELTPAAVKETPDTFGSGNAALFGEDE